MDLLLKLRDKELLRKIRFLVDGVIVGYKFTSDFNYNLDDLKEIKDYCTTHGLKYYIVMDDFISESEITELDEYLGFVKELNVDGIYFHDLGVYYGAIQYNLVDKLIYDGYTVLCNGLDSFFFLSQGVNSVVLSRELTIKEIAKIIKNNERCISIQAFGHLRMSYSKRKFLTNYFNEINKEIDYLDKDNISLVEESRNYKLPVKETKYGTNIYTDYILLMYEEFVYLRSLCKRVIVDNEFISNDVLFDVLRDFRRLNENNAEFLKESLIQRYPDYSFATGYLYQKTVNRKEENEQDWTISTSKRFS